LKQPLDDQRFECRARQALALFSVVDRSGGNCSSVLFVAARVPTSMRCPQRPQTTKPANTLPVPGPKAFS
jgi:hypothetical protein